MKHFINGHWYTELGRRIKLNDLFRDLMTALNEYKEFHNEHTKRKHKTKKRRGMGPIS